MLPEPLFCTPVVVELAEEPLRAIGQQRVDLGLVFPILAGADMPDRAGRSLAESIAEKRRHVRQLAVVAEPLGPEQFVVQRVEQRRVG